MVIKWTGPPDLNGRVPEGVRLAVIMCPVSAINGISSTVTRSSEPAPSGESGQFLCAMVSPGVMSKSFTVDLWLQVIVDVQWMDGEVMLEYDSATRYYHMGI